MWVWQGDRTRTGKRKGVSTSRLQRPFEGAVAWGCRASAGPKQSGGADSVLRPLVGEGEEGGCSRGATCLSITGVENDHVNSSIIVDKVVKARLSNDQSVHR